MLGAGSSYGLGSTGGNANISLGVNNMPKHRHKVDSASASISAHVHGTAGSEAGSYGDKAVRPENFGGGHSSQAYDSYNRNTKSAGGGTTGSFAPYTDYQGSGQSFSIMPPYIAVNIWKRTS